MAHSKNSGTLFVTNVKVAEVLEREMDFVIRDWMTLVEKQEDLMHISLNFDERTDHLPQLLRDVIARLRLDVCTKGPYLHRGRSARQLPSAFRANVVGELPFAVLLFKPSRFHPRPSRRRPCFWKSA